MPVDSTTIALTWAQMDLILQGLSVVFAEPDNEYFKLREPYVPCCNCSVRSLY